MKKAASNKALKSKTENITIEEVMATDELKHLTPNRQKN